MSSVNFNNPSKGLYLNKDFLEEDRKIELSEELDDINEAVAISIPEEINDIKPEEVQGSSEEEPKAPLWKRALCIAAASAIALGLVAAGLKGAEAYSSYKAATTYLNMGVTERVSHLEEVAKRTQDLCQDRLLNEGLCKGNLDIPRIKMPQVADDVADNYLETLRSRGVSVQVQTVPASSLTATQNEMNSGKVLGMVKAILNGVEDICKKPILVAKGWVVDGHHRYAACALAKKDMAITHIDRNIGEVLSNLDTFPGVKVAGL